MFNLYFYLKESNYIVICEIWLFELVFPQNYNFDVEVRIFQNVLEGPFDFEITGDNCMLLITVATQSYTVVI